MVEMNPVRLSASLFIGGIEWTDPEHATYRWPT